MTSLRVKMHFHRKVRALKSGIVQKRAFDVSHSVILGLKEERSRCFLRDVDVRIGCEVLFRQRDITRIDNYGEVRTTA